MNTHDECKSRLHTALHELRTRTEIEILAHDFEGAPLSYASPEEVDGALQQRFDTHLPSSVLACTAAHETFGCHWSLKHTSGTVNGEFNLHPPATSLPIEPPSLEWDLAESEEELSEQFLVIDEFPGGGTDSYTALRLVPGGTQALMWYHEAERGALPMNIDYCMYLRALAVTKGTLGWQFLFVDVSLEDSEFSPYVMGLKAMLAAFPGLFPDHDYAPLRERLEARL
ncbi:MULTISPECIES: hypothetical protein [Streptomyces]|uniref:hypothetical protein n=1 Tax=Streptomyces TaxID=1883 RepID=UPI0012FFCA01|nr:MULTISPECIES: hypothetical protein [Streptomyces]MCC3652166.1 hypothetical protein [Streptomyces sp. S07_1.15]MZE80290.1 hypothetical protein [Streptomyces sp. SID5475]